MKRFKIFFAVNTLNSGGIEKAAISLLSSLNPEYCDITLSVDRNEGIFKQFVPSWINIKTIPYNYLDIQERTKGSKKFIVNQFCKLKILSAIRCYFVNKREHSLNNDGRRIARALRFYKNSIPNTEEYDLAVAFADLEEMIYVSQFVNAKRKIGWFHTQLDPQRENLDQYTEYLDSYDSFYCVSNSLLESMKKALPKYSGKMKFYPHIINSKMLYDWGASSPEWPNCEGLRILSVGRLAHQKGFDLIPEVACELLKRDRHFTWYIIGAGPQRDVLTNKIQEKGLEGKIFLLGEISNPYPFFKECDIYVQTSRYEGYCLTLAEARAFHKPIVTTIFDGSQEQIQDGVTGTIVNFNVKEITDALDKLCLDANLRKRYIRNLQKNKVDNLEGVTVFMNEVFECF